MKFYYVLTFQSFRIGNEVEFFFCNKQLVAKIPLAFEDFNIMSVLETSYNQLVRQIESTMVSSITDITHLLSEQGEITLMSSINL